MQSQSTWLSIGGLRGKGTLTLLAAPLRLARALFEALAVMRRHRPVVVVGLGGFVSGPGGVAAWLCRRPLVIHEQNAIAGFTNRYLARLAPVTRVVRWNGVPVALQEAAQRAVRLQEWSAVAAHGSDLFVSALEKHGKEVTYLVYPDEGHDYLQPQSWISFWAVVAAGWNPTAWGPSAGRPPARAFFYEGSVSWA